MHETVALAYYQLSEYSEADRGLIDLVAPALSRVAIPVARGATWTTDAPFRETAEAIATCRARGVLAVEMEAAALYAFARARRASVLCFAHVTNRMARLAGDFEKGDADGARDALEVISAAILACRATPWPALRTAGRSPRLPS